MSPRRLSVSFGAVLFAIAMTPGSGVAGEFELHGHRFTTPDGFVVERIAGPPLVNRLVSGDFDEQGRLYLTDSSGSNEPVAVQREKRPHRIVRLVDEDGDGVFDKSTVYADKLMFPEGALWFEGSLYVAAPPEIWKFTDRDDDGVAEHREVWFDGKTLTHCANDLHGPYLGPDGWMYWCKGAFAEQTYERPGRPPLKTKAAHVFRRRPEGGPIEAVMTGGMDNPVEIAFTPEGERIFTTTFLTHPKDGLRDGLIHAVYGGVYGKDHHAIDGHPRTGELLPPLAHLGAAAPCGLTTLRSNGLGEGYRHNVLATLFNMHKVTRHVLRQNGAALACDTSDLLTSDNLDFHPTDVIEDADGSIIVVDTGGWFRLCCPTSQLEKPEVLGGVYRLRRLGAKRSADPRGRKLAWSNLSEAQLVGLLRDPRPAVRQRATRRIATLGASAVGPLRSVLENAQNAEHRRRAIWALTRIDGAEARVAVRFALRDHTPTVQQAALHSISVRRDAQAAAEVRDQLRSDSTAVSRAAAECLGRIGSPTDIPHLLAAIPPHASQSDRVLEHSLIYAAMELNDPDSLRPLLKSAAPHIRRGALIALDQTDGGQLKPADVRPLLRSKDAVLRRTAWWIAERRTPWADMVGDAVRAELKDPPRDPEQRKRLTQRLVRFAGSSRVRKAMAETLASAKDDVRILILQAMAQSRQRLTETWEQPLAESLSSSKSDVSRAALAALQTLSKGKLKKETTDELRRLALDDRQEAEVRLRAFNLLPTNARSKQLEFILSQLSIDSSVVNRALAVDLLKAAPLDAGQLTKLAAHLPQTGVMELPHLTAIFAKSKDPQVGEALVDGLLQAPSATSLLPDRVTTLLAPFGESVAEKAKPLIEKIESENQGKLERLKDVLARVPKADSRRGLKVFQSSKASCIACHRRGYLGGDIGPDLNRIGRIRSERDLLESILFPNLTFVRSYEPVSLLLNDGRVLSGLVRNETDDSLTLQIDAQKSVTISKSDIEERQLGKVSIMPAGLEKQLSPQDLADLVKYLKEG